MVRCEHRGYQSLCTRLEVIHHEKAHQLHHDSQSRFSLSYHRELTHAPFASDGNRVSEAAADAESSRRAFPPTGAGTLPLPKTAAAEPERHRLSREDRFCIGWQREYPRCSPLTPALRSDSALRSFYLLPLNGSAALRQSVFLHCEHESTSSLCCKHIISYKIRAVNTF